MRGLFVCLSGLTTVRAVVSVTHNMLNNLAAIQRREGLNDRDMAARLGISRPTWNRVRNGRLPLTDEVAMRAAGLWPELTRDLLERAASTVSEGTNTPIPAEPAA